MSDDIVRPSNGVLLIVLQSNEDTPGVPSAATDAVPVEDDSVTYNNPYRTEDSNEINGSLVAAAPMIVGQPATISFRSRLKGAGAGVAYTSSVKPPLHAALQACGMRGQFTSAIAATALTAGGQSSATLASPFLTTMQAYRGMPLILSGAVAPGRMPLITDYNGPSRFATLSDLYGSALTTGTSAALPANWSYAGTSPADVAARATDHPCATIYWFEDGLLYQWVKCRGSVDFDGAAAKPGIGTFNFTGIFVSKTDAAVPNAVLASHSAPMLVQGSGPVPAFQVASRGLAISKWSLSNGAALESPEDPNTTYGFQAGQIAGRKPIFEADPLMRHVAVQDALAEIAAAATAPIAVQLGTVAGNRVSVLTPFSQPIEASPGKRGSLRSETRRWQATNVGDDAYGRDSDRFVCFS